MIYTDIFVYKNIEIEKCVTLKNELYSYI